MWATATFSDSLVGWLFLCPQIAFPHACANQYSTECPEGTSADLPASFFMTFLLPGILPCDLHVQGNLYLSSTQEPISLCLGSPSLCRAWKLSLCSTRGQSEDLCQLSEIPVLLLMTNVLDTIVSHILSGWGFCCCCFSIVLSRKLYHVPVTSSWLEAEIQAMLTF